MCCFVTWLSPTCTTQPSWHDRHVSCRWFFSSTNYTALGIDGGSLSRRSCWPCMVSALLNQNSHSPKRFTDFHSHQHGLDQEFGQIQSSRKKSTETLCVPHLFIHYKHSHIRVGCASPPKQGDLEANPDSTSPTCIYFSRHPSKIRTVFLNRTQHHIML